MRIALVNLYWPREATTVAQLIEADATRRELAAELARRGHDVHVVQEGPEDATVTAHGATWHVHTPRFETRAGRRVLRALGHLSPAVLAPATGPLAALARIHPEIIHSFDLVHHPSLALLGWFAERRGVPLVAHYHGGEPAHHLLTRPIERFALRRVSAVCFTDIDRAQAWPLPKHRIVPLVESSTTFEIRDRTAARKRTGMRGNPAIFCPGRLDAVKDPLTTIRGFAIFARAAPEAHLTLTYTQASLFGECKQRVDTLELSEQVSFAGRAPHADMNDWFSSADIVVQSSVREVCGIAIVEAMACGIPPVVTDIPAFRFTTANLTSRFPVGDAAGLAAALVATWKNPPKAAVLRAYFDANLSFDAMAAQLEKLYNQLTRHSSGSAPTAPPA